MADSDLVVLGTVNGIVGRDMDYDTNDPRRLLGKGEHPHYVFMK